MEKIGPFNLYQKTPNDIHYGKLYTMEVELPILYSKKRIIRVYLPEDYNPKRKYPVLFMADGQNIVDKYTSAFGAWSIDIHEHNLINKGVQSFIVVGIDSPKDPIHRALEYSFPFLAIQKEFGGDEYNDKNLKFESHILYDYIAHDLFSLIKENFSVTNNRKLIGVGGSSMGGVFSLSLITLYPDVFGFALVFSPGLFLYKQDEVKQYLNKSISKLSEHKLFFYSGNVGFESKFLKDTINVYNYFINNGFKENVQLLIDEKAEHNEYSWSKHFEEAVIFWLK